MPVDAKELRIGNFVKFNGKVLEVESIGDQLFMKGVNIEFSSGWYGSIETECCEYEKLEPIPISSDILEASEWLLEEKENTICYSYDGFKVWVVDNEGVNQFYHLNSETLTFFDYVHQIQNYFYAISEGQELEIKFP